MSVLVAAALAACGGRDAAPAPHVHVEPEVNFALPPATDGCSAASALPGGGAQVPIEVSTVAGQVAELVSVCIAGHRPFPFVLDSGAVQSTIDAHLAHKLQLRSAGPPTSFSGVDCRGTAQPVSVDQWSREGVELAPQILTSATLPEFGGNGEPVGLLGPTSCPASAPSASTLRQATCCCPVRRGSRCPTRRPTRAPSALWRQRCSPRAVAPRCQ
jgi:hypothetical protein